MLFRSRIAPAGIWRGQPVPGDVNDQNAAAFGGVAGHAGVFSTGRDLARFAQVWLREGMAPKEWEQFRNRGALPRRTSDGWEQVKGIVGRELQVSHFQVGSRMATFPPWR